MNRRTFLRRTVAAAGAASFAGIVSPSGAVAAGEVKGIAQGAKLTPPSAGRIPVAILISEMVNVVDFSGPWGVFESAQVDNANEPPFNVFSVAETPEIVTAASGLKIKPDYTFANVPDVKVVVVPAQMGSDAMIDWLKKTWQKTDLTMSVCTGAFKLAKAGLLAGKPATTHHAFLDKLEKEYPDIEVKRGVRFVETGKIATAAGLTSGTDLALRLVERYFGRTNAQATATYMEYTGTGWQI